MIIAGTVPASDEAETAQKVAQTPPIRKILDKVVGVILRGLSPHDSRALSLEIVHRIGSLFGDAAI